MSPPPHPAVDPGAPTRSLVTPEGPSGRRATDRGGERIGRFQLRRLVGQGGMGAIYEAWDETLRRRVAIKLLLAGGGAQVLARMVREARAAAGLSHPNVVAVYEVGAHGDEPYIAMEYVDGVSLVEWLAAAPRGWRDIVEVFLQAGRGLAAAHAAGIVHRDVKPANILVAEDRARVADFGLARSAPVAAAAPPHEPPPIDDRLTHTGVLLGTPRYMAPEQRAGGSCDARSDQYSFCLSLHEALFAALPGERPGRAREVPRWLLAVLERGLRARPSERYPDLHALLADLARGARAPARRRILVAAGAAALLAAAIAAVVLGSDPAPAARPVVVIEPLETSGDAWVGAALERLLAAQLSADEALAVLPGSERARATVRLAGRVAVGEEVVLVLSAVDARGELLAGFEARGARGELAAPARAAAASVRARLGLPALGPAAADAAARLLPRDPEATRLLLEGEELDQGGALVAARARYEAAVRRAPENALAAAALGSIYTRTADPRRRAMFDRARALAADLPREQRLSIEARSALGSFELDDAAAGFQALHELFPENHDYLRWLLQVHQKRRDPVALGTTLAAYRLLADEDDAIPLLNLEYELADLRRDHRRAREFAARIVDSATARGHADDLAWGSGHVALEEWHLGDLPAARRHLATARAGYLRARGYELPTDYVAELAVRLELAADRARAALAVAELHGLHGVMTASPALEARGAALAAEALLAAGQLAPAAARARHAAARWEVACAVPCAPLAADLLGRVALAAGDLPGAEAQLAALPADGFAARALRAETLVARGRGEEAVAEAVAARAAAAGIDDELRADIAAGRALRAAGRRADAEARLDGAAARAARHGLLARAREARSGD
jgi:hypothetical protein